MWGDTGDLWRLQQRQRKRYIYIICWLTYLFWVTSYSPTDLQRSGRPWSHLGAWFHSHTCHRSRFLPRGGVLTMPLAAVKFKFTHSLESECLVSPKQSTIHSPLYISLRLGQQPESMSVRYRFRRRGPTVLQKHDMPLGYLELSTVHVPTSAAKQLYTGQRKDGTPLLSFCRSLVPSNGGSCGHMRAGTCQISVGCEGRQATHLQMAIPTALPLARFLVSNSRGYVALCLGE